MGYSFLSEKKHELILLYKMINGLCPDYLSSRVPPAVGNNTAYNLRNASDYKYIYAQILNCVTTPFFLSLVRDWTELPLTTINATSLSAFMCSFNSTLIGVPLIYLDGNRIGQIYHARLRMDCSSLNHHLISKTLLTVRYAFVVDQKLPSTTCLIVIDLATCARK